MLCSLARQLPAMLPVYLYPYSCGIRFYSQKHHIEGKPPGKVKFYIVQKYVKYIGKVEQSFENKYPKAFKVYKLFKDGVKDFFNDTKMYLRVTSDLWAGRRLDSFSRIELDNYRQVPTDMVRVGPVLLIASLPFANYVVFPIAYLFPRQLLSRQFWTPEQRIDFALFYLKRRLHYYPSILHYMEKHTSAVNDVSKRKVLEDILTKLERGGSPSVEELLLSKDLFVGRPFGLNYLSKVHKIHTWHLAKTLNLTTRRHRLLLRDIELLQCSDLAMLREGIDTLSLPDLQQSCFTRGLNSKDVDPTEMIQYLKKWTAVTKDIDESSLSLLLHLPLLLSYGRPSNKKFLIEIENGNSST